MPVILKVVKNDRVSQADWGHNVVWIRLNSAHFNPTKCRIKYPQEKKIWAVHKKENYSLENSAYKKNVSFLIIAKYTSSED